MKATTASLLFLGVSTLASAAPLSGKVCVGTWNTQAEFADVRVTKAGKTLYPSVLSSVKSGWITSGGSWSQGKESLRQTGGGTPALATIGRFDWSDYTLTLKARKTGGAEGFLIGFGMAGNAVQSWWNVGGWNNTQQALQAPGFSMLPKPSTIETGRWYAIKVEVKGSDVRCYLDGEKVYDTMRLSDDAEWTARDRAILDSAGLATLPGWERDQVRELLGRPFHPGRARRARYEALPGNATFETLAASEQAALIRRVNRHRMTWSKGWGWGNESWRDDMVENSMDGAVTTFNAAGIYDKRLIAHISPGTPTADAGWGGEIRFGGSREYTVALHEISHTLGTGTTWQWDNLMWGGDWHGTYANARVAEFDGPGSIMHGDNAHYWPYGMFQIWEWNPEYERRLLLIIEAFRRDMGLSGVRDTAYTTEVPNGTYRLTPRLVPGSAVEATGEENGAPIAIRTSNGGANQRFTLQKESDGTYSIRTTLPSRRALDLPGGVVENGAQMQLWDDLGGDPQRWYLIPTGDGWYKIAPKNDVWKTLDLWGVSSADGTPVKLWDFYDGIGQQFRLDRLD